MQRTAPGQGSTASSARRWRKQGNHTFALLLRRLLTDFVGLEEFPALSPDGKYVAFTADVSGTRQLMIRLLAGGAPLQVTQGTLGMVLVHAVCVLHPSQIGLEICI